MQKIHTKPEGGFVIKCVKHGTCYSVWYGEKMYQKDAAQARAEEFRIGHSHFCDSEINITEVHSAAI